MSYLALARKWRPRTFSQLVGQDHINKALIKSLNQQRVHHAYLFTGTRGVGKTSVARLMAKALNCEQGLSAEPCLQCETCLAIEQGRFIDLIEIDGASKTRVEDTRDILENVQYLPTSGRYKIYLIDEVHMLSQHSFNALLKTLEEPPAHVKFLLATTDPQKLPVTVLSRCLQFSLKHLSSENITNHLAFILGEENLSFEEGALPLLAKAARGSMRDALSLLDQAIASSNDILSTDEVKQILGYTQKDYAIQLLQALSSLDAGKIIALCREIAIESGHFTYVLEEILNYCHQITLCQTIPESSHLLDISDEIQALAEHFTPADIQLFYQIGLKGCEEIHLAPGLAVGFEMTVLRMFTFRPETKLATPKLAFQSPVLAKPASIPEPSIKSEPVISPAVKEAPLQKIEPAQDNAIISNDWNLIIKQLKLTGLAQNAAENAEMIEKVDRNILLRVAKGHQSLFNSGVITRLEQALSGYYKESIKITFEFNELVQSSPAQQRQIERTINQQEAETSLEEDSFIQQIKEEFSAELVKNSIASLKDEL